MLHPYFRLLSHWWHPTLHYYLLTLIRKMRSCQNLDRKPTRNFCRCLFIDWHRYWITGHPASRMTQCPDMCCKSHIQRLGRTVKGSFIREIKPMAQLLLKSLKLFWFFFNIIVNVVSDSRILVTFQSDNYIFFLTKMVQAGSFGYEWLAD